MGTSSSNENFYPLHNQEPSMKVYYGREFVVEANNFYDKQVVVAIKKHLTDLLSEEVDATVNIYTCIITEIEPHLKVDVKYSYTNAQGAAFEEDSFTYKCKH